ncbi:MAG: prepilin-type N-terminal cleavage/methylation domain-containing protein [Candidatus Sumerlaeia bacterium]
MFKRGFTLIELLIVVAIIAILAAIAVPNFLEAQVRAKVSRIKSDMRSVSVALESYAVDNGQYLVSVQGEYSGQADMPSAVQTSNPDSPAVGGMFYLLSTPISYLSNAFIVDPFFLNQPEGSPWSLDGNMDRYVHYYAYSNTSSLQASNGSKWGVNKGAERGTFTDQKQPEDAKARTFVMISFGPDRVETNIKDVIPERGPDYKWTAAWNDYWIQHKYPEKVIHAIYDPTNGTKSAGNIFRVGSGEGGKDKMRELLMHLRKHTN